MPTGLGDNAAPPIGGVQRVVIGVMSGLAAVCTKVLRQDLDLIKTYSSSIRPEDAASLQSLFFSYYLLIPILMFLGGLICWLTDETNRLKLFWLGVAAPALITTYAGGPKEAPITTPPAIQQPAPQIPQPGKAGWLFELNFVSSAHAQTVSKSCTSLPSLVEGIKIFFGEPPRYYVIVGGYKSKDAAEAKAKEVNKEDATMKAFVGLRKPCNDYYPVIVGNYVTQGEANKLMQKAKALSSADDVYLSDYPDRVPDKKD